MYVRTECSHCEKPAYHNGRLHALVHLPFDYLDHATCYTLAHIEVSESITEHEMAHSILQDLRGWVYDGMSIWGLCRTIKDNYGVAVRCCCDIIESLKLDLCMYSPDRKHLKVIE